MDSQLSDKSQNIISQITYFSIFTAPKKLNGLKYDIIIIGAGIVGLATALKIKEKRPHSKVLILDKEDKLAVHQTGHNSGVIDRCLAF